MYYKTLLAFILAFPFTCQALASTANGILKDCFSLGIRDSRVGDKCINSRGEIFEWTGNLSFTNGGWKDSTGLIWSAHYNGANANPDSLSYVEAKQACADLDARLPTKEELDRANSKEFFFEPVDSHYNSIFWTATQSIDSTGKSCMVYVDIMAHQDFCYHPDQTAAAICVKQ